MNKKNVAIWLLRIALAGLYLMMSLPKFAGDEVTIHIFSSLGVEPWGRYLTGIIEILVFILVLVPATTIYGIFVSLATIFGALMAHFFVIGIVVKNASGTINDGGQIFTTALIILALSLVNLYVHRTTVPGFNKCSNN